MDFLALLGIVLVLLVLYKLAHLAYGILWPYLIGPRLGMGVRPETQGKWAVITGATDGIGRGYAEALAARGMNVYLMSRTEAKLQAVAEEIRAQSPKVEVRTYRIDFSTDNLETYDDVERVMQSLDIGVLVNNVGMITDPPQKYLETPRAVTKKLLMVNDLSCLMMTNVILPGMLERKRGALINISSTSALAPERLMGTYSAGKVFVDYFTHALRYEYAGRGVTFQIIQPGWVATKMAIIEKTSYLAPDPRVYAESCLNTLGLMDCGNGYLGHHLETLSVAWLPESVLYKLTCTAVDGLRDRALEKINKAAKRE